MISNLADALIVIKEQADTIEQLRYALAISQNKKQEIAFCTKEIMDKIDDARNRGAYNDLSIIAYTLINKLISTT